jgi:hypothetical protein
MFAYFENSQREISTNSPGDDGSLSSFSSSSTNGQQKDTAIHIDTNIQCLSWMGKASNPQHTSQISTTTPNNPMSDHVARLEQLEAYIDSVTMGAVSANVIHHVPLPEESNSFRLSSSHAAASSAANSTNTRHKDWKCEDFLYYQEGWLATGNTNSIVGCTFTSCISDQQYELLKQKELAQKLNKSTPATAVQQLQPDLSAFSNMSYETAIENASSVMLTPQSPIPGTSAAATTTTSAENTNTTNNNTNLNRTNFNLRGHKSEVKNFFIIIFLLSNA